MKTQTIRKKIESKLNQWLETITDRSLAHRVETSLVVSGGSICSMYLNEPVNDYDIYLQDIQVCKDLVEYYIKGFNVEVMDGRQKHSYIDKYKETGGDPDRDSNWYVVALRNLNNGQIKLTFKGDAGLRVNEDVAKDEGKYVPKYFSANSISLSDDIQIVLRFGGTPAEIHKTFDFVHATNYFTFKDGLVINLEAIECILTKTLKYQGSFYPVTSVIRAKKFIKRGFNISAGEYVKMLFQISMIDLSNPDVLEEQLTGLDVAYFDILIQALRGKKESEPDFKVTPEYFNEIIDRVFNQADEPSEQ